MFDKHDYHNILALVNFAFQNGMVKSQDDAKVLFLIEAKAKEGLQDQPVAVAEEESNGDDVPAGD